MTPSIFRTQALQYQRQRWNGRALLATPLPLAVVAGLSLLFVATLLWLVIAGRYTRRVDVIGEVVTQPHAITLYAPQQGYISQTLASPGQRVARNQPLYQLNVDRTTDAGDVSRRAATQIQSQIERIDTILDRLETSRRMTLDNLREQLAMYRKDRGQARSIADSARAGMGDMQRNMQNYESYLKRGLVTKDQSSNQRYLYYQQQYQFQSLYNQSRQDDLQITNLDSQLTTRAVEFDNQIAQYHAHRDELQRQLDETEARGSLVIKAPTPGRVQSMAVTVGQMVQPGDSLAQLSPVEDSAWRLIFWVPSSSVPYLQRGQHINIRYDAFPYQKFSQFDGVIDSISAVAAAAQEMASYSNPPGVDPRTGGRADTYYKVTVQPERVHFRYRNRLLALSSGMRAEATLFLEKRPLYQWILAPFYDIRSSVDGPVHG
ncbi:HlyD family secretion protein [Frateuria aurantia]